MAPDTWTPDLEGCVHNPQWWDRAYLQRIQLRVSEGIDGSLPAGYSVVFAVDTTGLAVLENGDDIRVVRHHAGATELHRRLVEMGTGSTKIWFKTLSPVSQTDHSYYIYFDNSAAGSAPAHWSDSMNSDALPSQVYLAADSFDDEAEGDLPNGWEGSPEYEVVTESGNRVLQVEPGDDDQEFLFTGSSWNDIVLEMDMRTPLPERRYYGNFVRVRPVGTTISALWIGVGNNIYDACTCTMDGLDPSSFQASCSGDGSTSPEMGTAWHHLEYKMTGNRTTFVFDEITSASFYSGDAGGRIGLHGGLDRSHAQWDNVVVRKFVDPEPTVSHFRQEQFCQ